MTKNVVTFILNHGRRIFNINKLEGKPELVQGKILLMWADLVSYSFFLNINPNQINDGVKQLIKIEIAYLQKANDFLNSLIEFSPFGRRENKLQKIYNQLIQERLVKILDLSHPAIINYKEFISQKPEYDKELIEESWIKTFDLDNKTKLKYSADPKYLINGFTYLIRIGVIELDDIESFVYANFNFSNRYKLPNFTKEYNFNWKGKVKNSFPQLLGQLKERRNITSTYEEIVDFVLQYIKIARDSAYQYATQKQKLSKNNLLDYKPFTPDSRYQIY
ncbi:hypothetical protein [Adhaeribacter radiodurans]|uniref:Uncharacterized protein n=1 Tax=Adhaeribacter radiodurans TaxID=2745197 RepID=A0A7L7LCL1_9BACT|nr:hypothetical protein [Adhaeribacter radiodurans]QMU30578.1 hypothetical protein HUW48_22255 [Adhaeribacter radiodurans]